MVPSACDRQRSGAAAPSQSQPSSVNRGQYGAILGTDSEQLLAHLGDTTPGARLQHSSNHAAIVIILFGQRSSLGSRSANRPIDGYGSLEDGSVSAYFFADIGSSPHEYIGVPVAFRC